MRLESKRIAIVLGVGLAACGVGKELDAGLDYGPEDAAISAKDDSATNPASMARLTIGTTKKTTFTTTSRWRAFKFAATAGVKHDIFVDGLRDLDTVAYVYNVSATTGRPYSRAIARNDDTQTANWTVATNRVPNPNSSSLSFTPRYSRDYAVVVTTYQQASRGTAEVVVRTASQPSGWESAARAEVVKLLRSGDDLSSREIARDSLPAAAQTRLDAMREASDLQHSKGYKLTVAARPLYLISGNIDGWFWADLIDAAGRWFAHGFGVLTNGAGDLNWTLDDGDRTICTCARRNISTEMAGCAWVDGSLTYSENIQCD